jgi:hypothetical protein
MSNQISVEARELQHFKHTAYKLGNFTCFPKIGFMLIFITSFVLCPLELIKEHWHWEMGNGGLRHPSTGCFHLPLHQINSSTVQ